jgi:hypothetical protein
MKNLKLKIKKIASNSNYKNFKLVKVSLDFNLLEELHFSSFLKINKSIFKNFRNTILFDVNRTSLMNNRQEVLFEDSEDYELVDTVYLMYIYPNKNGYVYFFKVENSDFELIELLLNDSNYFESEKYNKSCVPSNFRAVRWLGAYNTQTVLNKNCLYDSLNWELQASNREKAADCFINNDSVNFWDALSYKLTYSDEYLYKKCKLGLIYDFYDIRSIYEQDIWSYNLGAMLCTDEELYAPDVDAFTPDNMYYTYRHTECFIKVHSTPIGVIVRKPNTWLKSNLNIVLELAKKYNITVYYVEY